MTANLYVPAVATKASRRPGMLYVCGHVPGQKEHYQGHARRFAELGFPTLIVETVQLGEVTGYHHGCYREGWFHWYSRGYSPAAVEVLNGVRGLDLLAQRPEVDAERLGVTGISGGGAQTWFIAAADERVKACSPVCATASLASHIYDKVIDGHCDCMWWINTAMWDLADIGALIAPRPLLHGVGESGRHLPDSMRSARCTRSCKGCIARSIAPRTSAWSKRPAGTTITSSRGGDRGMVRQTSDRQGADRGGVGDFETDPAKLEPPDTLRVYSGGAPEGNRALTIQNELITVAAPPSASSAAGIADLRKQLVAKLRGDTFNHFPRTAPRLDVDEEYALDGGEGTRFAFTSEDGWRLHGIRRNPSAGKGVAPAVVVLRSPGEGRYDSDTFAATIRAPWIRLIVETRGTGDTSWGEDLNWHIRRAAAWTGRTVASMRVWDALRALEAARALPGVDAKQIAIAARGEMAAVALYAALLDGRLSGVFLHSPPPTQNASSQPTGKGPAIEMLNCLRHTDLAQVAGLLYPTPIVIAGEFPPAYAWAEDLYRGVTPAGRFHRVASLTEWSPAT